MITTLLLAGALAQTGPAPDPGALAAMLAGAWDNAAQIEAEGDPARPHLHVRHELIDAAGVEGAALYAELRVGGPEGEVYRQRVYVIGPAPGGADMTMAVYELANPERFAGPNDAARAAVSADDLVRFDPGCDFVWRQSALGWAGEIEDDACVRTSSRTGRDMIIGARFTISATAFTHSESGRYADTGEAVFGPPDGVANIYDRMEE